MLCFRPKLERKGELVLRRVLVRRPHVAHGGGVQGLQFHGNFFFSRVSDPHTRQREVHQEHTKTKKKKRKQNEASWQLEVQRGEHEHEGPLKLQITFELRAPMELSIADNGSRQATLSRDHQSCSAIFRASIARRSDEGELFIKREIDMDK